MYGETYIVWVIGSKSACEKEMLTEKLQIDTEIEMLARGTSASLRVGDDKFSWLRSEIIDSHSKMFC